MAGKTETVETAAEKKAGRKARLKEIELAKEEIELAKLQLEFESDERKAILDSARKVNQCTYVFSAQVDSANVEKARESLDLWHAAYPKDQPFVIELFSPGGSVFAGYALYDTIRENSNRGHHVTVRALGYAASMAAVLLQAGDTREIGRQTKLMLHEVSTGVIGKAFEIQDEAELAKRLTSQMCQIFADRAKKALGKKAPSAADFFKMIDRRDCWVDAEDAVKLGLADAVIG